MLSYVLLFIIIILVVIAALLIFTRIRNSKDKALSLYFSFKPSEEKYFRETVLPHLKRHNNVVWYHCSHRAGSGQAYVIESSTGRNRSDAKPSDRIGIDKRMHPDTLITSIVAAHPECNVLVYSGHSGGSYIGEEKGPMTDVPSLVSALAHGLDGRQYDVIYFDSCNMGMLPWVAYFEEVAKVVVGAPNYYDWASVLESSVFYEKMRDAPRVVDEFAARYNGTRMLVELGVYDTASCMQLYAAYRRMFQCNTETGHDTKYFDASTQIEDDIHDLGRAAQRLPPADRDELMRIMRRAVIHRTRCSQCAVEVPDSTIAIAIGDCTVAEQYTPHVHAIHA